MLVIKGQFFAWYDIGLFHNVRTQLATERQAAATVDGDKSVGTSSSSSSSAPTAASGSSGGGGTGLVVRYRAKIKLHGTNAGVSVQHGGSEVYIQSRNTFVTKDTDHHGFAHWALQPEHKAYFRSLFRPEGGYKALTIFGEYCGKGAHQTSSRR